MVIKVNKTDENKIKKSLKINKNDQKFKKKSKIGKNDEIS